MFCDLVGSTALSARLDPEDLRALPLVHRRLSGISAGLCATVHDELLVEAAESDADNARRILEETMIEAFELTFPGAPTAGVVKVNVGKNWAEAK
jgi:DNA polymerase I-like protein with 3'-5' exonuclease and polymerase domains